MAYLGAILGLRWGEVAGLRVRHVDFLAGTVTVAEQLTRGEGGRSVVGAPKSAAGRRVLSGPRVLLDMLAVHLARRGLTGADDDEFVFVSPCGEPLDYSHWRRRVWLPACADAGVEGLVFHDLRRAAATALVLEGVDMKTAQTRLGHSDPRLTLGLYAQASNEADRDAAERVGARFVPGMWDGRWMEPGDEVGALRAYHA
jgi:integrase